MMTVKEYDIFNGEEIVDCWVKYKAVSDEGGYINCYATVS